MSKFPIPDDLSIPEWLKISAEDRKKAWVGVPLTDAHSGRTAAEQDERIKRDRELRAEEKRLKNEKGLLRLKLAHKGHVYDRNLRIWSCKTCKHIVTLCTCEPPVVTHNAGDTSAAASK